MDGPGSSIRSHRRPHRRRVIVTGALAAAAVATCAVVYLPLAQAGVTAARPARNSISWGACPAPAPGVTRDPRTTCGTVTVPLDYRHPRGQTITVEVSRIATAKPGKKRGDLLFNPGGPGLEGLDTNSAMAPGLPASVTDEYDLIGFDPRGVGHSTPMSCGLTGVTFLALFPYPAADGSIQGN